MNHCSNMCRRVEPTHVVHDQNVSLSRPRSVTQLVVTQWACRPVVCRPLGLSPRSLAIHNPILEPHFMLWNCTKDLGTRGCPDTARELTLAGLPIFAICYHDCLDRLGLISVHTRSKNIEDQRKCKNFLIQWNKHFICTTKTINRVIAGPEGSLATGDLRKKFYPQNYTLHITSCSLSRNTFRFIISINKYTNHS